MDGHATGGVDLAKRTLAVVLAGGAGRRLKGLTRWHAKPALPFAGNYRNVDFPLSNCINSGIRRVAVLTQYKAHSLIQHLSRAWSFLNPELGEFIELWPAQQRCQEEWYTGTANALYQNLDVIAGYDPDYVLVLAGDHVYKMDYVAMVRGHVDSGADVTVGCIDVPVAESHLFGIVRRGTDSRSIKEFVEKPQDGRPFADERDRVMASMGIYVFSTEFLRAALLEDEDDPHSDHDFGGDVIPKAVREANVCAYELRPDRACGGQQPYWRDIGTLDSYWQAHMELLVAAPPLDLNDRRWPIRSHRETLPPARFIHVGADAPGVAVQSMVADGCTINGGIVLGSVLSPGVRVDEAAQVRESVIFDGASVGRRCRLRRVIVEGGCEIPDDTVIGEDLGRDRERFDVSEQGVVLVTREALGTAIPVRAPRRASKSGLTRVA